MIENHDSFEYEPDNMDKWDTLLSDIVYGMHQRGSQHYDEIVWIRIQHVSEEVSREAGNIP